MPAVGEWLASLGLPEYADRFAEHRIDFSILQDLTDKDLKEELGIVLLGDRRRLLRAIAKLAGATPTEPQLAPGSESSPRDDAERRQVTVMFADLVGSTALSTDMDPEDLREIISAYQQCVAETVHHFGGFVARYVGDGVLVYFGYPRAHEDDAERAVRAGLELITMVAGLKTRAPQQVRVGIATGVVVVGHLIPSGESEERGMVGETPNLAARLQTLAEPGTIVIAASTRRLLGDLFRLRDLGRHKVKGIAEPIAVWAVEGVSPSESRFEAVRAAGLIDFIGREDEIDFLLERQRRAWRGEGQVVLISGEPGIGKSRLAAALAERIAGEPHTRLRYQCSPYYSTSALRPFIAQLERAAGFKADDTSEQRLDKLEALLAMGGSRVQAVAPVFAALLSIPFGERYAPLALSPTQQRRRTLVALLDQFESAARRQPLLLSFEDAHWADATSLELLDLTIERARQLPILALFTFRPEFEPPWVGLPNVSSLTLGRLDRANVESIVAGVTGGRPLPAEVTEEIVVKTDGNPLFVEELTKAVLETGILVEDTEGYRLNGPLPPLAIPATLHDSLMARLDRLTPVKEIGQIGAAIGREFSYPLLRAVVGRNETVLKDALAQLEGAELVFRRGEPPEAVYSFKHALVRDAAYESLLKSRRQQLHGQIARKLEAGFPDVVASEPEIVARHFTEAGLADSAITYWLRAGNLALSRSANAEAVKHLRQGIELTRSLAPSPERVRKELDLYLALGPAMAATEGDAAPETLRVFSRARELLSDGGTLTERMTVLWGAYLAHSMRAEHSAARDVAHQCLALAAHHDHPGISALANRFMGQTLHFMGGFVEARAHLERTLDLCAANQDTIAAYRRFGTDDRVNALSFLASTLLLLGYPEQPATAVGQAVSRAHAMGLAYSTALALSHMAILGTIGCDPQRAAAHADEAIALSVEHGLASPGHRARFIRGALLARNGDAEAGIELMRNAIAATEGNAERNRHTLYLSHLASAHASLGQPAVALDLLDEAIQTAEVTSERFFEAELYRLRGEMLLTLGKRSEAEAGLRRALTIAQQQEARWWELRSATTLAKLWQDEGKYLEAYFLLQPVYEWFVEGFDTTPLKDAKALLGKLRDASGPQEQARCG